MSDLDAYGSVIDDLREQAKECKVSLLLTYSHILISFFIFMNVVWMKKLLFVINIILLVCSIVSN